MSSKEDEKIKTTSNLDNKVNKFATLFAVQMFYLRLF
jgi:hypothetical protein